MPDHVARIVEPEPQAIAANKAYDDGEHVYVMSVHLREDDYLERLIERIATRVVEKLNEPDRP